MAPLVRISLQTARSLHSSSIRRMVCAGLIAVLLLAGLPAQGALAASDESPVLSSSHYIVRHGDTLSSIARRFGTTAWAIARANGIQNLNHIYVGQRLHIPTGHSGSSTGWPVDSTHYIVQPGDSLSVLARRFNTTVQAIARANGIYDTSHIYVGQRLVLPTGYASPPSVYGFTYRVKPGDTLSEIAKWYGVSLRSLAAANGLHDLSYIYVGQRLYIP